MRLLLLWSGGVESTSLLKWHLENTSDEIFAHRVIFHNPENRNDNETKAIETLMPLLQAIRPFNYDTSELSICDSKACPLDRLMYQAIGALAMYHHRCVEIRRGYCAEDQWSRYWFIDAQKRKTFKYVKGISLESNYLEKAIGSTHFLQPGVKLEDVIIIHPTSYWTKAKHVAYLGGMFKHTWSCREPVKGKECGWCHSCMERTAAIKGTSNIPEVANQIKEKGL